MYIIFRIRVTLHRHMNIQYMLFIVCLYIPCTDTNTCTSCSYTCRCAKVLYILYILYTHYLKY